jgi:hypothetical protein
MYQTDGTFDPPQWTRSPAMLIRDNSYKLDSVANLVGNTSWLGWH